MNLYITSDHIGSQTGGGVVTANEYDALLGPKAVINPPPMPDPFISDEIALGVYKNEYKGRVQMAHLYAGTYSKLVAEMKKDGVFITYTAAAHDVEKSRAEYQTLGCPFDYPHLNDPTLFQRYVQGYLDADLVICPSNHSKNIMHSFGCKHVLVIPHGCDVSVTPKPIPKRFTVGYLGQCGPDKGIIYLVRAWKMLGYRDAQLVIAGRNSETLLDLVRREGGGAIHLSGFVRSVSDLYDQCSVYVQPSVTEGFGIEVLEAMAHGRPVIASSGAGSADCVGKHGTIFAARCVPELAEAIEKHRKIQPDTTAIRRHVGQYSWEKIRSRYTELWRSYAIQLSL